MDPLTTQPAADAYGPLMTSRAGSVLINLWEVDSEGRRAAPTGLTIDVVVITWSTMGAERPAGALGTGLVRTGFWGRGLISTGVTPGEWQIQTELASVVGFQIAVLAKTASPAGRFLAIVSTDIVVAP